MDVQTVVERFGNKVRVRSNGCGEVWLKPSQLDGDGEFCVDVKDLVEAMQFVLEHNPEED